MSRVIPVGLRVQEQKKLLGEARAAARQAYAPYSNFHVGAAILTWEGGIYRGCNVETGRQAGPVCAERNAVTAMVTDGAVLRAEDQSPIRAVALSCIDVPAPVAWRELANRSLCGACRQVVNEFAGPETLIVLDNGRDGIVQSLQQDSLPLGFRFAGPAEPGQAVSPAALASKMPRDSALEVFNQLAREISVNSYPGILDIRSGAVMQMEDGKVFFGAGAVNSSTGLTIYADRAVIHAAVQAGVWLAKPRPVVRYFALYVAGMAGHGTDWLQRGLDAELAHEFFSPDTVCMISAPAGKRIWSWGARCQA